MEPPSDNLSSFNFLMHASLRLLVTCGSDCLCITSGLDTVKHPSIIQVVLACEALLGIYTHIRASQIIRRCLSTELLDTKTTSRAYWHILWRFKILSGSAALRNSF